MKGKIKEFALNLGIEDVGFVAAPDYKSPRSPDLQTILPGARSLVVLAYESLSNLESDNMQIAMGGRLDELEFARSSNYRMARFLNKEFKAKAMTVPPSYPLYMSYETKGTLGEVSLRHAAVAAGLGNFGRHNLVIHPKMGTRVLFTALITDLDLPSDSPLSERLCTDCNACVENCPAGALNEEGKTDDMKCLKNSQPYGIGSAIRFWTKFVLQHLAELLPRHLHRHQAVDEGQGVEHVAPGHRPLGQIGAQAGGVGHRDLGPRALPHHVGDEAPGDGSGILGSSEVARPSE